MSDWHTVAVVSCLAMMVAWLIQLRTKDAGIVDVFWAFGMALAGAYYAYMGAAPEWLRFTLAVLVVIWFSRLGFYIFYRGVHQGEDGRYKAMREWLGGRSNLGFFVFFQVQAGFIILLSLPFLLQQDWIQFRLLLLLALLFQHLVLELVLPASHHRHHWI